MDKQGNLTRDDSYFNAHSDNDPLAFLADFLPKYEARGEGLYCMITGNHDCMRTSFNLNDQERKLAFAFLLTMPGAPFIYYGDEIGMMYRWLPTKEGGYHRTGTRTPMQWNSGKNLGFSDAEAEKLYLPVDPNPGNATVEAQEADPDSMLNHIRRVLALRKANPDLGNYSPMEVYYAEKGDKLFALKRGEMIVAVNPGLTVKELALDGAYEMVYTFGEAGASGKLLTLGKQSLAVLKPLK
jgi:maltose alpha-D-glucosyltransferase/alpha-amylase